MQQLHQASNEVESSVRPARWASEDQPAVVANPKGSQRQQFYAQALVGRCGSGKAAGTLITEKSPKIFGETQEEVQRKREEFIREYLQPVKRAKNALAGTSSSGAAAVAATLGGRPSRAAKPLDLQLPRQSERGAKPGTTAGPGRGHTFQSTKGEQIQELLPSADALDGNWLRQHSLRQKWKTDRIAQLEQQLAEALSTVAAQQTTIAALREKVREMCSTPSSIPCDAMANCSIIPFECGRCAH